MIEAFLRRNPELHIYSIGDLDDFFWPYTAWHGLLEGAELTQVRRLGAVFDFFQKNTLDTNLSGAIWGILFA
jgi:hypothetical protein